MKIRFIFLLILIAPLMLRAQAYFQEQAQILILGNSFFEFSLDRSDCSLRPVGLKNKLTHDQYLLSGNLFSLTLTFPGEGITPPKNVPRTYTAQNFILDKIEQKKGADELTICLWLSGQGLQVKYVIAIPDRQPFFRIELQVKDISDSQPFLEKIAPWSVGISGAQLELGGFGQPVFGNDFFVGVEFPAAYTQKIQEEHVKSWHYVAARIPQNTFYKSHAVVVGVTLSDKVQAGFYDYIRHLRPRADRPFTLYNTWYDIRNFTYKQLLNTIRNFDSILVRHYGLKLDAFVIDDGWDNVHSVWEIDQQKFPQGFSPLVTELKKMHSALGLWISPWNGYDKARTERIEWAKKHGFKLSAGRHLCLGDTAYYKIFKEKVLQYQKEGQLSFYKIDGFLSVCNESDHNHLPGIYSRELLTRRFIEILQALRRQNPDIFIDITVGTWLSPWWLQYADAVWMTGADFGHAEDVPAFSERDKAITFRDYTLYKDFVRDHYQFPLSNVMTHGIIKGKLNLLGGKEETLQNWQDNAVMYFARGVMMWELYLSPEILSPQEWDFLAAVMKWAKSQTALLGNTEFIGGNPYARQIYGYVHRAKGQTLLVVRNPFVSPKTVEFNADQLLEKGQANSFVVREIYPQNKILSQIIRPSGTLKLSLQGYEVRVLHLQATRDVPPLPSGVTLQPLSKKKDKGAFRVYLDTEDSSKAFFPNASQIKNVYFNKKKNSPDAWADIVQKARMRFRQKAGRKFALTFEPLNDRAIAGSVKIKGESALVQEKLAILFDFTTPVDSLRIRITERGQNVQPILKKGAGGLWYWILLPLNHDSKELNLRFSALRKFPEGKVSFWVMGRKVLPEIGRLTLETKTACFDVGPQIPAHAESRRVIRPILRFDIGTEQGN